MYLLRCGDGTLYCGVTNDLPARLAAHTAGRGAKYTRGRGPLELVLARRCRDRGRAQRLEHAIKGLPRRAKLALVDEPARLAGLARSVASQASPR